MGARLERGHHEGLNGAVAIVLRDARVAAGLTIEELAERAGIPTVTVQRLLAARRPITMETLAELSLAVNLSPATVVARAHKLRADPELVEHLVAGITARASATPERTPRVTQRT